MGRSCFCLLLCVIYNLVESFPCVLNQDFNMVLSHDLFKIDKSALSNIFLVKITRNIVSVSRRLITDSVYFLTKKVKTSDFTF